MFQPSLFLCTFASTHKNSCTDQSSGYITFRNSFRANHLQFIARKRT